MTAMKSFRVTFWENNRLAIMVRARSEYEAIENAQCRYAAASPPASEGFDRLDDHSDDWDARPATPRKRRRS